MKKLTFRQHEAVRLLVVIAGTIGSWYLALAAFQWGVSLANGLPRALEPVTIANLLIILGAAVFMLALIAVIFLLGHLRLNRMVRAQNWLLDAVNVNFVRLAAQSPNQPSVEEASAGTVASTEDKERWPWGDHHTESLGHLEAAACRFWKLYDPTDSSTAPTNEMVSEWLQNERGTSKEKARAIASMLRPDGLATGPRR